MKKIIITLFAAAIVFALLLPKDTSAQDLTAKGVKVGLNIANIGGDDADPGEGVDKKSKMGFAVGLFNVLGIHDNLGIRSEILFSMKGFIYEGELLGNAYKVSGSMTYLEALLLIQYTLPVEGSFKPNVFIGPAFGINLSTKSKVEFDGEEEEDDIEDMKSVDFGLVLGAGAVLNDEITFDIRYNLGLTSFNDTPKDQGGPFDIKNRVISILLGYSF